MAVFGSATNTGATEPTVAIYLGLAVEKRLDSFPAASDSVLVSEHGQEAT